MASPMKMLKDADMRLLAALWRELADAPAAECDAALRHCMERLSHHIGASNVAWVAADRQDAAAPDDAMRGWRVRAIEHLHCREHRQQMARELSAHLESGQADPYAAAVVRGAGHTRCQFRHELLDDDNWYRSWIVQEALAEERIDDRLNGTYALAPGRESHFVLDRRRGERPFGEYERDLLQFFLLGSRTFQRELLLSRGLIGSSSPFSPRERDIAKLLLTDASEKEIALLLGIGHRTVHQHAASIYAKLGVRGRQGLMARWLRDGKARSLIPVM